MVLAKSWNMIGVPNLITNTNGSCACIDQTNNKHLVHDKGFGVTFPQNDHSFCYMCLLTNCIGSDHPACWLIRSYTVCKNVHNKRSVSTSRINFLDNFIGPFSPLSYLWSRTGNPVGESHYG